ncbi:AAA family ATPase [Spirulina subsalsa]|uniref:AAA family ATPase n=1 Tax=Spirulina subsalsa TaxID=54311 RepID=UPI0002F810BF|nr:AAA family ATPase [Spirulina subsalsa]
MKIQVKNLGVLKQAEFSLGEITIICGGNNTGKSYATYALYGFLSSWKYLVKELNTLIMLSQDKPYLKDIAKQEGYSLDELLSVDQVKAYIAEQGLISVEGKSRRSRCQTLIPAKITPEFGVEITSFDTAIAEMNRIQEAIVWGGE